MFFELHGALGHAVNLRIETDMKQPLGKFPTGFAIDTPDRTAATEVEKFSVRVSPGEEASGSFRGIISDTTTAETKATSERVEYSLSIPDVDPEPR